MARQQVYTVRGTDLVYNAHGFESVHHSIESAEKHAADSGAEPVYVGDTSKVAKDTSTTDPTHPDYEAPQRHR